MKPDGTNLLVPVKAIYDEEGNSVESAPHISELAEAGIDIVTCGLAVYEASFEHPFTTHGLGIFREAWDSTATE